MEIEELSLEISNLNREYAAILKLRSDPDSKEGKLAEIEKKRTILFKKLQKKLGGKGSRAGGLIEKKD